LAGQGYTTLHVGESTGEENSNLYMRGVNEDRYIEVDEYGWSQPRGRSVTSSSVPIYATHALHKLRLALH
jgi:hypothetical protein